MKLKKIYILVLTAFAAFIAQKVEAQAYYRYPILREQKVANADGESGLQTIGENILSPYHYPASTLDLASNTALFVDKVLDYKILFVNLGYGLVDSSMKIIIFNGELKTLKVLNLSSTSSNVSSFYINSFDFYPSEYQGNKLIPGELVVRTDHGDLFLTLKDLEAKFLYYSKRFFEYPGEDITIQELQKS